MESSIENLNRPAFINGLILAVISFAINVTIYYAYPQAMGSAFFGILTLVASLILYVILTLDLRKKVGGYWTFRQALKGIFLMTLVSAILGYILQTLFYKFIEPDAYEKILGYVVKGLTKTYENFGMDQDEIDKTIAKISESLKTQFNPGVGDFLKNLGVAVLIQFILSLIFAAIFKKERPIIEHRGE